MEMLKQQWLTSFLVPSPKADLGEEYAYIFNITSVELLFALLSSHFTY